MFRHPASLSVWQQRQTIVTCVVRGMTGMSVLVHVSRMQTKQIGSCAVPRCFLDPQLWSFDPSICLFRREKVFRHSFRRSRFLSFFCFSGGSDFSFSSGWVSSPCASVFFEVRNHPFELLQRSRHHEHVVSKTQVGYAISFFVTQFDVQTFLVPNFMVFLHCWLKNRVEKKTAQPCFVPRAIMNSSLSTSISMVARWSAYNCQKASVLLTERMVSERATDCIMFFWIEYLLEVDRHHPQVNAPFSAFLNNKLVRQKTIYRLELLSESCLVMELVAVEFGI